MINRSQDVGVRARRLFIGPPLAQARRMRHMAWWIDCTLPGTGIFRLRRRNLLLVGVSFIIDASLIIHDVRVTRPPFCFTRANRWILKPVIMRKRYC